MLDIKKLLTKILTELPKKAELVVESHSGSVSLPASDSTTVNVTMTKSGFTFLGVVGFRTSGSGSSLGFVYGAWKSATNTASVMLRNTTSTARSYTVYVYGLYQKN